MIPELKRIHVLKPAKKLHIMILMFFHLICLRPLSFARVYNPKFKCTMSKMIDDGDYDIIHYDMFNMAQYYLHKPHVVSVHSPNDATSRVYNILVKQQKKFRLSLRTYIASRLIANYEKVRYPDFDKIHVVTEIDRDYLVDLTAAKSIDVISISSGYNKFPAKMKVNYELKLMGPRVVVSGDLQCLPIRQGLYDFIDIVLPRLIEDYPMLQLDLLVRNASASAMEYFKANKHINYLSWVDDFEQFLRDADLVLLPDKVGPPGIKTRTLQAMALGVPVVGMSTAFDGLSITDMIQGVFYENTNECYVKIVTILQDKKIRERIGLTAAHFVAERYSLTEICGRYESMYQSMLGFSTGEL